MSAQTASRPARRQKRVHTSRELAFSGTGRDSNGREYAQFEARSSRLTHVLYSPRYYAAEGRATCDCPATRECWHRRLSPLAYMRHVMKQTAAGMTSAELDGAYGETLAELATPDGSDIERVVWCEVLREARRRPVSLEAERVARRARASAALTDFGMEPEGGAA